MDWAGGRPWGEEHPDLLSKSFLTDPARQALGGLPIVAGVQFPALAPVFSQPRADMTYIAARAVGLLTPIRGLARAKCGIGLHWVILCTRGVTDV